MMGFDLFILAILLVTTIRGAAKGVAWQLAGIAALVLCFMFATPLSLTIAPMIKLEAPLNRWVAMLGIYLVFSFGTFAIARGFREALEKAKFVEFDRHLGALFGLFKGAIIALVITFFCVAMSKQARDIILKTHTGYAAAHIMNAIDPVMPKELHAILEPYIHQLDAVDPELAAERERHHQEVMSEQGSPAPREINPRTGKSYRPIGRDNPLIESEDSRVAPRDPFQDDDSGFAPSQTDSATTQSRLRDLDEMHSEPEPEPAPAPQNEGMFGWLKDLPHLAAKITPAIKQQLHEAFQNTASEHREEFIETLKNSHPQAAPQVANAWKNGRPAVRPQIQPLGDPFDSPVPEEEAPPPPSVMPRPRITQPPPLPPEVDPNADLELNVPPRPRSTPVTRIRHSGERPPEIPEDHPQGGPKARRHRLLTGIAKVFSSRQSEQAQKMTEIETTLLGLPDPVVIGVLEDWLSDLRGADPDPDPHTDLSTNLNVRVARQVDGLNIPHNELSEDWRGKLQRFLRN